MRVGILTFHNAVNYGGVLQAYALQQALIKLGLEVEIIDYYNESIQLSNQLNRKVKLSKNTKHRFLKTIYIKGNHILTSDIWKKKYNNFKSFRESKLNLTKKMKNSSEFDELNYDALIFGSDQIWNPNITGDFDFIYFGKFKTNAVKIAYAASCGSVNTIKENKKEFIELISNLDYISTREKELQELIVNNTTYEVIQTIDPTLLLSHQDYNNISINPESKNKYLLIYKLQDNKEIYKCAKKIAKEKNLQIYEIGIKSKFKNNIKYFESVGPEEFLGLFKNAEFVITNSFHGTVFSIINKKNFYTIPHKTVGERMIDLLNRLDLDDRLIRCAEEIVFEDLMKINYEKVENNIDISKKSSIEYLKNTLSIYI